MRLLYRHGTMRGQHMKPCETGGETHKQKKMSRIKKRTKRVKMKRPNHGNETPRWTCRTTRCLVFVGILRGDYRGSCSSLTLSVHYTSTLLPTVFTTFPTAFVYEALLSSLLTHTRLSVHASTIHPLSPTLF